MALTRDLLPDSRIDRGETGIAVGAGVDFGQFQAVGDIHPLRVDFGAADHGDLSGETPQRVAGRNRARIRKRGRHHRARSAKARHRG